jgi:hydrogenase expression/formation protein HypE
LHADALGADARQIGVVRESTAGIVMLRGPLGTHRRLDMLSGEQLPRIC